MAGESLRIGCVKYLNAQPLIHGWPGPVVFDHPTALCQKLAAGELDVAFVSSFEFWRRPIYSVVDNVCVSSDGPVYSVFVAHTEEWSSLKTLELDPASQTSVNLLRCLLAEAEMHALPGVAVGDAMAPLAAGHARLLIGDQAIRFRQKFGERYRYWDLGGEWQRCIGLPFVYALWLIRPEVISAAEIATQLRAKQDSNLADLASVIAAQSEFAADFCEYYFRSCLRFTLDSRAKEGLRAFREICQKHRILPQEPDTLRFV